MATAKKTTQVPALDGIIVPETVNANQNGDPDDGGNPRRNAVTDKGLWSRESINRRIRDYVYDVHKGKPGFDLFIKRGNVHETLIREAYVSSGAGIDKGRDYAKGNLALCEKYFDVRWFGLVVTKPGDGGIRGPICINIGESVYPITHEDMAGTRQTRTNEERAKTGSREMSHKRFIPHAVFTITWHLDPFYAQRTGFDKNDLEIFLDAITRVFRNDHSSMRGRINLRYSVVFEHEEPTRNAEPCDLFELLKIKAKDPHTASQWSDYTVTLPTAKDLPAGVTMKILHATKAA